MNVSSRAARAPHYLDVDPYSVELIADGSYVRAADPRGLADRVLTAVIPPRHGSAVCGLRLASNFVLHSGVDDADGHFIAAYGSEERADAAGADGSA